MSVIAAQREWELAEVAQEAGAEVVCGSSLKANLDHDWDQTTQKEEALSLVLATLTQVESWLSSLPQAEQHPKAQQYLEVARQVKAQDVEKEQEGKATLIKGVAKDRRISVEDGQMRHGRKSRSVLFDGYKRHVLRDLDTGLVPAVGITPANAPEASVTGDIAADLDAAGWHLAELHIDRAYLSSALVRDRGPDLAIFCKAWRVRNATGRFAKDQFALDFGAGQLT